MSPFGPKKLGKIWTFLKCDILPIFDITKLRGKKKKTTMVSV
jgi:hypothetical protein